MKKSNYQYNVSLSFAREDQNIALAIYTSLQLKLPDIEIYYYPDKLEETIGEKLKQQLTEVYSKKSEYVIPIISKNYINPKNEFVQTEIKAFVSRIKPNEASFLIPILIDDTKLSEVNSKLNGLTYFKWELNPSNLSKIIKNKLSSPKTSYKDKEAQQGKNTISLDGATITKTVIINESHGDINIK